MTLCCRIWKKTRVLSEVWAKATFNNSFRVLVVLWLQWQINLFVNYLSLKGTPSHFNTLRLEDRAEVKKNCTCSYCLLKCAQMLSYFRNSIKAWSTSKAMHIIKNPNEKGIAYKETQVGFKATPFHSAWKSIKVTQFIYFTYNLSSPEIQYILFDVDRK